MDKEITRRRVVKQFIESNDMSKFSIEPTPEHREWIIGIIKDGSIPQREDYMNRFIRVDPDTTNPYDRNALAVYLNLPVKRVKKFWDIGFLPKHHSKELVRDYPGRYLIGMVPEGIGFRLHFILFFKEGAGAVQGTPSPQEEHFPQTEMMSLKEMRKSLEVR